MSARPQRQRPRIVLDATARRWLLGVGALLALVVAAAPLLTLAYSVDTVVTVDAIVVMSLLCEGAEAVDEWRARTAPDVVTDGRDPLTACRVMRVAVAVMAVALALLGVLNLATGAGGGGAGGESNHDLAVGGGLMAAASGMALLLFWQGTGGGPPLRRLRPGRPITWFAILTCLQALAQNLTPASAAQSVASVIARPATAGDLIVGSLPYGAIALLAVGPVVRRGGRAWLTRLGLLPRRLVWLAGGLVAGILFVPVLDACFGASTTTPRELAAHLGPLGAGLVVLAGSARARRRVVEVVVRPRDLPSEDGRDAGADPGPGIDREPVSPSLAERAMNVAVLTILVVVTLDAVGLAVSILAMHLPSDCLAQQAQVSQSLSGGPTGRRWYENAGIALAAGVDEELLFRGVLQPRIGLVLSALLFASFHLQYTCHGLPSVGDVEIVLVGVAFGLIRRQGGLGAAILAHAGYDGAILLNLPL